MSLLKEYIDKMQAGMTPLHLEQELQNLIRAYNAHRGSFLFFYASATHKPIDDVAINMADYYVVCDMLRGVNAERIDFYIQTPGGSGEAVEEIVRFLRSKFNTVDIVVAGEAKSAGTILALSGDDILMTDTGSLGPIDAQVPIGRMRVSASDYIQWVEEKQTEARQQGVLSAFDATIIAQISPGEVQGIYHAYRFAEDLVKGWLPKYKFKNWSHTETRGLAVTEEMKVNRAKEIVKKLADHSHWCSHGRSIKREDLARDLNLKITRIDDDPALSDIVYRLFTVSQLLLTMTESYKLCYTEAQKIHKSAVQMPQAGPQSMPGKMPQQINVAEVDHQCPQCGKLYRFYLKFVADPAIDATMSTQGRAPFPVPPVFPCGNCGHQNDLGPFKNNIEMQLGRPSVQ